eukprot:Tbor_TRINITY_DN5729_c1_g1::TRINITY_DN5729_c1_g1_i4::g.19693::m.19693
MQNTKRSSHSGNSSAGGSSAQPVKAHLSSTPKLMMQPPSPREEEYVSLRGGGVSSKNMSVNDESEGVQACAKMLDIMGLAVAEAGAKDMNRSTGEKSGMTTEALLVLQDMERKAAETYHNSSHKKINESAISALKADGEPVTFSGEKNGRIPNIPKLMALLRKMTGKEGQLDLTATKSKCLDLDLEDLQELALALGETHALSTTHDNSDVNIRLLSDPAFLEAFKAAGESLEVRFQTEMQGGHPR